MLIAFVFAILFSSKGSTPNYSGQPYPTYEPTLSNDDVLKHWKRLWRKKMGTVRVRRNDTWDILSDPRFLRNPTNIGRKYGFIGIMLGKKVLVVE